MPEKYYSKQKENIVKRCFKGIGYWFLGNFMCFFVCSATALLMRSFLIFKMFIALCTLVITMGLYFNWAHYAAKLDKNLVKFHNMKYDKYMPVKMSVIAPFFTYVMLIFLYLSKVGIIPDIFNFYLLGNMWLRPFVTMFTGEIAISSVSWSGMIGITFLVLLQPLTIVLTYIFTYNDLDIAKLIFYNNDKK